MPPLSRAEGGVGRQDASRLALPGRVGASPTENCVQPAEEGTQPGRFVPPVPGAPISQTGVEAQGSWGPVLLTPGQLEGQGAG